MLNLRTASFLVAFSVPALAKQIGYFDADSCVDPRGLEECYANAHEVASHCILEGCEDGGVDCLNLCYCLETAAQIECAGTSCWNQVYSCEYQLTVNDLTQTCVNPELESIPFFPPPDDAAGSCSCNIANLLIAQGELAENMHVCVEEGDQTVVENFLATGGDVIDYQNACLCCGYSAALSIFYNVCPETDPAVLGINEWYVGVVEPDLWPQCDQYMAAYPCSQMGYSPPGGRNAKFYAAGGFPENGTATITNVPGAVTSPVSGEVYTWTWARRERVITVASADAKPTGKSGSSGSGNGIKDGDEKSGGSSNSKDGNGGDGDGEEDSAVMAVPKLVFVVAPLFLIGVLL